MKPEQDRGRLFTRRALFLGGGQAALFLGLSGRMYYLQVIESNRYLALADENRISLRLLVPARGRIVDRNDVPMAVNVQNYGVVIVPEEAKNVDEILLQLSRLVEVSEQERKRVLREAKRRRAFLPITVRENLSWEEVSRIEVNLPDLPGISIVVGQTRHYPQAGYAAHVLGYVAAVSEGEQTGEPLLEQPGFRIGKNGVERQYDLLLRGAAGKKEVVVNALGRVRADLKEGLQEAKTGEDIQLTVDVRLQAFVAKRIAEQRRASVIVMDAHAGDILAMSSTPYFDPHLFNKGLTGEEWKSLVNNPDAPLTNKVIAGQYAPGSTFKIVVALAALEAGISPAARETCYGDIQLGNQKFHCWKKRGHGSVDLIDAIRESCDVYFYELSRKVGIERMSAMARKMGLGSALNLDIPGEKPGLIPTPAWKQAMIGVPWQLGETLVSGIGQGYVLTTPLQIAVMVSRLVNGGYAVSPRFTLSIPGDDFTESTQQNFPKIGLSKRARRLVMQGMDEVVNKPKGGTAYRSRIADPRFAMAGKTGTSQVRRISLAERDAGLKKNSERPWRERDHALFVGYAPVDAPRYVVAVVIEHGGGGSKAAAPIARDVLIETQRLDPANTGRRYGTKTPSQQAKRKKR